jgi:hypothetical protein
MNRWLITSVSLNGALLILCFVGWSSGDRTAQALVRPLRTDPAAAQHPGAGTVSNIGAATPAFHWRQIEHEDYRVYMANLRAVGCPEDTVRDILRGDIEALFAEKRRALVAPHQSEFWWRLLDPGFESFVDLKLEQLNQLQHEHDQVLEILLGSNWQDDQNLRTRDEVEEQLDFLPDELRKQIVDIQNRWLHEFELLAADTSLSDQIVEQTREGYRRKRQAEIAALLSPEQLAEFNLRTSDAARQLRGQLAAFNPSEDEFRQLHQAQLSIEAQFANARPGDDYSADTERLQAEKENRLQQSFQSVLSAERYALYKLSRDPGYRADWSFAQRYGLTGQTAHELARLRQMAEETLRAALPSHLASPEQQSGLRQSLKAETEAALRQTLGPDLYQDYLKNNGAWIEALTDTANEAPIPNHVD